MPDQPNAKLRHPADAPAPPPADALPYAELDVVTNYSFGRGASHADELVGRAGQLGHRAIGVTDVNTLAGVVRAHVAVNQYNGQLGTNLKLLVGCRLVLTDAPDVLVWVTNRAGYANLCQLLTVGKRRAPKGQCDLSLVDLLDRHAGLLAAVDASDSALDLRPLREAFGHRLSLVACCSLARDDAAHLSRLVKRSHRSGIPLLATNGVHYHDPARRPLQDVLTCVRHRCTIHEAGHRLFPNAERHLKDPDQMHALFHACPAAVHRTIEIADQCTFSLDDLKYEYPAEVVPIGVTPLQHLADLTWAGAATRYPNGVPDKVRGKLRDELALIKKVGYEHYFLTVHDIVKFARSKGILCQGRGSAANSAVCYCLGVTAVDPNVIETLFARFISESRGEPPDIDVDFEHERREEVIQYVYAKYGRDRAGMTAEVITYRGRSAVRDVAKVLGLRPDTIDAMAKKLEWWDRGSISPQQVREAGLDPADPAVRRVVGLSEQLLGFPRHLSQHVGGMVMTRGPLCELVPIENGAMPDRTVIEWDKDDIDALGILKVDLLGLGMLTAIAKCLALLPKPLQLHEVPSEDPATYDMICRADTVGVFQIESRAQMTMLPRLRPRVFYDLVIEVAIVRPGPIQGDMVHPYLRRRNGEEPTPVLDPKIAKVLDRTRGVPLFQEQAMALVIEGAGFTPNRADQLRKAMAAWKRHGGLEPFHDEVVHGMLRNGFSLAFAEQCFNQIKGFGEYGFPESHAASFALLAYVSCWLKRHHPAALTCALLNSQPMGFYAPAQLVRDAADHGVPVLPIDVNHSAWDCTLASHPKPASEGTPDDPDSPHTWGTTGPALRLGLRMIKGLSEPHANTIVAARHGSPYASITHFHRTTRLPPSVTQLLAEADAFRSLDRTRRPAAWDALALTLSAAVPGAVEGPSRRVIEPFLPLHHGEPMDPIPLTLPQMPLGQEVLADYTTTRLSLKAHPVSLVRPQLAAKGIVTAAALRNHAPRRWLSVAGLVLVRQRPGTAGGIVFMTLEDETGTANLIVRPSIYERYRPAARHALLLQADGRLERHDTVTHLLVFRCHDLGHLLSDYQTPSRDFH